MRSTAQMEARHDYFAAFSKHGSYVFATDCSYCQRSFSFAMRLLSMVLLFVPLCSRLQNLLPLLLLNSMSDVFKHSSMNFGSGRIRLLYNNDIVYVAHVSRPRVHRYTGDCSKQYRQMRKLKTSTSESTSISVVGQKPYTKKMCHEIVNL